MSEFVSNSGADVVINVAPFKDSMALKNSIVKELLKSDIDIANIDLDFTKSNSSEIINTMSKAVLTIDSSEVVYNNVFKCLSRSLCNGEKITEATFENEKIREDYYQIVLECLKVNVLLFFKGIISKLMDLIPEITSDILKRK